MLTFSIVQYIPYKMFCRWTRFVIRLHGFLFLFLVVLPVMVNKDDSTYLSKSAKGFRAVRGQKWGSSLYFNNRPYNRSALLCCLGSSSSLSLLPSGVVDYLRIVALYTQQIYVGVGLELGLALGLGLWLTDMLCNCWVYDADRPRKWCHTSDHGWWPEVSHTAVNLRAL